MLIFLHYYNIMKFIKKLLEKLSSKKQILSKFIKKLLEKLSKKQIPSKNWLASRRIKHYDDCY